MAKGTSPPLMQSTLSAVHNLLSAHVFPKTVQGDLFISAGEVAATANWRIYSHLHRMTMKQKMTKKWIRNWRPYLLIFKMN